MEYLKETMGNIYSKPDASLAVFGIVAIGLFNVAKHQITYLFIMHFSLSFSVKEYGVGSLLLLFSIIAKQGQANNDAHDGIIIQHLRS